MRLRNVRRGHNKPGDNNNEFEENNNDATQQIDLEDEVQLMKSLIVNDENMAILVEKLNITREYRGELIKKPDVELKTCFPYFFTHPPLVCMLVFFPANIVVLLLADCQSVVLIRCTSTSAYISLPHLCMYTSHGLSVHRCARDV